MNIDESNLEIVANVLRTSMMNAGYFDDWDEIVIDRYLENGLEETIKFAQHTDISVTFINDFQSKEHESFETNFTERAYQYINNWKELNEGKYSWQE